MRANKSTFYVKAFVEVYTFTFDLNIKKPAPTFAIELLPRAPYVLPELKYVTEVTLLDDRYHGFSFKADKNWEELQVGLLPSVFHKLSQLWQRPPQSASLRSV